MDVERNGVPTCSWNSSFSLRLLTVNLAGEEAGKKEGKGKPGLRASAYCNVK